MNIHNAAENGKLNRVKELLNQGVPVNTRDAWGQTPLHCASEYGHLNVVKELIRRGARVNSRTPRGLFTPLQLAAYKYPRIVHALIKAGANPKYINTHGCNASNYAAFNAPTRNAIKTSRAASTWLKTVRKRKAGRMLASPRLLGSTILNNKSIANIARYLTVEKKNNIRK
jgi:ankyrin repeat protein